MPELYLHDDVGNLPVAVDPRPRQGTGRADDSEAKSCPYRRCTHPGPPPARPPPPPVTTPGRRADDSEAKSCPYRRCTHRPHPLPPPSPNFQSRIASDRLRSPHRCTSQLKSTRITDHRAPKSHPNPSWVQVVTVRSTGPRSRHLDLLKLKQISNRRQDVFSLATQSGFTCRPPRRRESPASGPAGRSSGPAAARGRCWRHDRPCRREGGDNLFIYQARESSLVPAGFLTPQFLQKMLFMKPLL